MNEYSKLVNVNNILVTGGAGFIGSNFLRYIINQKKIGKIVVLDNLTYASHINTIQDFIKEESITFVKGNILDEKLISDTLNENHITHLVNFAAESHVDNSIINPYSFLETNILGTFNLLKTFLGYWESNNKPVYWRFLHVSTDEVFGSLGINDQPFNEESRYDPRSPYSASKASSDHLLKSWCNTYDFPGILSNCSNNYGPYQHPEKLIPLTIDRVLKGEYIPIYGKGENIRDWIFVDDHCEALLAVLFKGKIGESYCIGGNSEISNLELVKLILKIIEKNNIGSSRNDLFALIKFVNDRPGHDKRYAIDSSKMNKELYWEPKHALVDGLEKTIKWYLNNQNWLKNFSN